MRWVIGADEHDRILEVLASELATAGHEVARVGATPDRPAPWGEVALEIARQVAEGQADRGLVCCYTGTGVSMAANKVRGVRAAECADAAAAKNAREHNDANVLTLGARFVDPGRMHEVVEVFLTATCTEERHARRVEKIKAIEESYLK
jgi:ribose 5-phosphate isomerase B